MNLTLSGGGSPAAIEWTFNYSTDDFTAVSVAAGASAAAAGKVIDCAGGAGVHKCLLWGMNANTMADGVVAVPTFTLSNSGNTTRTIQVASSLGASTPGAAIPVSGGAGTVTVSVASPPQVGTLTCSPSSVNTPGSASCSVGLTLAAPSGGAVVALASDHPALTVPVSVTVAAGATSASFTAQAAAVTTNGTAQVTASLNGTSKSFSLSLMASTSPPTSEGLVAAWGFNEGAGASVADATGNGLLGTISGATWTTQGRFGGALSFDGVNDWVTVNHSPLLGLTNGMTLEAWVYPTASQSGWRTILQKQVDAYFLHASSGNGALRPAAGGTFGGVVANTGASTAIPAGAWTHLAFTYDGAAMRLYVNGVQVSSVAQTGALEVNTNPLRIGGNSVYGEYFQGRIDEVRIYNRALSQAEIQTDMSTPVGGGDTTAPTVSVTSPAAGATVSGAVTVTATASDNVGVAGVQFLLDGAPLGSEITAPPYSISWDTTAASNGPHTLSARARDAAGNTAAAANVNVQVSNVTIVPEVSGLACSPAAVNTPGTASCTITLSVPAPAGGATVALASNHTAVSVPASAAVAAGATGAAFTATVGAVSSDSTAQLTASLNGGSKTFALSLVAPAALSTLACSPSAIAPGEASTCTVALTKVAPAGGFAVGLSSSSAAVTVLSSLTVPAGSATASFQATAGAITADTTATITASAAGVSRTATVAVVAPPQVSGLTCSPASVNAPGSSSCTVTLSKAAGSGGASVALSSNHAVVTVPASVSVAAGATTAGFTATVGAATADLTAQLTASLNGSSKSFALAVSSSPAVLTGLICDSTSLPAWSSTTCSVTLSKGAPAGGAVVALSSNKTALKVPASVTVPAGASQASFTASLTSSSGTATITARWSGVSKTFSLTLIASGLSSLTCAPATVVGGQNSLCTLTLVPYNHDVTVALSSNNSSVQVPRWVTVRAMQSSVSFAATTSVVTSARTAKLTAKEDGKSVSTEITVQPASTPRLTVEGEPVALAGQPVRLTIAAEDALPVALSAEGLPDGARFDAATGEFDWTAQAGHPGPYRVRFTATNSAHRSASEEVLVEVVPDRPVAKAVVNAASRSRAMVCSPGSLASVLGTGFMEGPAQQPPAANPVTELAGVRVKVNGEFVPVLYAAPGRVNFQCPDVAPGTSFSVLVENPSGASEPIQVAVSEAAPGIFTLQDAFSDNRGFILRGGARTITVVRQAGLPSEPAQPGDSVVILATGLGRNQRPLVWIGETLAEVESVQASSGAPGVSEIAVRIPAHAPAGDAVPVRLQMAAPAGKLLESNVVTMAIEEAP